MGCGDSKRVIVPTIKNESNRNEKHQAQTKTDEKEQKLYKSEIEHPLHHQEEKKPVPKHENRKTEKGKEPENNKYKEIDEHARKAPKELKYSSDDLVNYMSSFTKDPEYLVRGFFIWISENIQYDVDGYFGKTGMAPCDSESVMKNGKSVCEGYAKVMEELCRKANVPVKKISGFAKGFKHTAEEIITGQTKTNHAWNAVQLAGKWYLLDSTWGSGNVSHSHEFKKKLNEFYFLTNPKHLICTHFPYINNDMEESIKWQLLGEPVSLSEFSRSIRYWPSAFKIGARAVSHTDGLVEMANELKMTFKSIGKEEIIFSARLELQDGDTFHKQENATYGYMGKECYTLHVHPREPGTYKLNIFGRPNVEDTQNNTSTSLMKYTLKCSKVGDKHFEYPQTYANTDVEKVILHEPLSGKLRANTEVHFKIETPFLQMVRVGKTMLQRSGSIFTGLVETGTPGKLCVWGNRSLGFDGTKGILKFQVV